MEPLHQQTAAISSDQSGPISAAEVVDKILKSDILYLGIGLLVFYY